MDACDMDDVLTKKLIEVINKKNPKNVEQLVTLVREDHLIAEKEILERVMLLQSQGIINLQGLMDSKPVKLSVYLKSIDSLWYWLTILLMGVTTVIVFSIPVTYYPLAYFRIFFGGLFILLLPGYSLVKAIFVDANQGKKIRVLDPLERLGFSLVADLGLVSIIGLFLNYTPWGISLETIVLSLFSITVFLATFGVIKEYRVRRS